VNITQRTLNRAEELCAEQGYNLQAVAHNAARISPGALLSMQQGRGDLGVNKLERIANALGVEPADLLS
jgi:hypothetical protein